jgi:hypothetical protein
MNEYDQEYTGFSAGYEEYQANKTREQPDWEPQDQLERDGMTSYYTKYSNFWEEH